MYCTNQTERKSTLICWILATLLTPLPSFSMHQIAKRTTQKAAQQLVMSAKHRPRHFHVAHWLQATSTSRSTAAQKWHSTEEINLLIFYCSASLIALTIHKKQLDNEDFISSWTAKLTQYFRRFMGLSEENLDSLSNPTHQSRYLCSTEEGHLCLHPALGDIYRMRFAEETSSSKPS